MLGRDALLELLHELELFVLGQLRYVSNRANTLILSLYRIVDRDVAPFQAFSAVELGECRINRKRTSLHKAR